MDAIESLDSGLVMYDADERLVICNRRIVKSMRNRRGSSKLASSTRMCCVHSVRNGGHRHSGLSEDAYIARRLDAHRRMRGVSEQELDGRWIRIGDFPTSDGGVVSLRTDITEIKLTQQELLIAKNR